MRKVSLLLFCLVSALRFSAQFDYQFWMPPIWQTDNTGQNQPSSLFITTPYSTPVNVRVQTPDGTTFVFNGTVTSGSPLSIPLTTSIGQTNIANTALLNNGLLVTTSAPVQCVHKVSSTFNQTLVTLKGSNGKGREFWCGSQVRNFNGSYGPNEHHFITVMATENNTQVTFQTPFAMWSSSGTLANPHTITLQKNQSYLIRGNGPLQHVAGARVTATKDIVCISGSTHTRIAGGDAADGGTDQLVPIGLAGTEFAAIKGNNNNPFDYGIVVATQNATEIFIDGGTTPVATINAGQFYDWTMTGTFGTPHYFRTSKTAYFYHVSGTSQDDEVDMSIMPELSCTGSRYIEFSRFAEAGLQQIMPVLASPAAYPTLRLNNVLAANVPGVIINNVPGLTGWKAVTFPNASLANNNILKSDGFFHAGWLTGNAGTTGAYGYLSGFDDAFEFQDPVSSLPTLIYQIGPLCQGQSLDHCVRVKSCGSRNRITSFTGNDGTVVVAPPTQPYDTCFRYTAPFNFTGFDTINFVFTNEFGFTGNLDIVIKVVNPNTPINGGVDQQICGGSTTTLTAVNADPLATGYWTVAVGTGVLATPNSPTTAVSNLALGLNSFIWHQDYPCAQRVDLVQVFRYSGAPPTAAAGPDALLCSSGSASYTMQANSPGTTATGTWEITSGNATIFNINSATATVSNIGIGINTFRWNISNGPCAGNDSSDEMQIFVYNSNHPAANAGADQTVCQGSFTSLSISANTPQIPATGQWSVVQGTASFNNATSPSTTITGLGVGVNILRWTINNGPCGTLTDELTITVFSPSSPNANAGPDQTVCLPSNSASLAGNSPISPAVGTWTVIAGSGSFTNPNSPTSTVSGLSLGANRFRWTINNGPCANGTTTDEVIITVFPASQPTANAGADQQICSTGGAVTATLIGNAATAPGTGAWTLVSGSGTIAAPNAATTTVSGLAIGQNTFQWTLSNGPCLGGSSDQITITVFSNAIASTNAGPDASLCTPATSYTMQAINPTLPATGTWSVVSGSGTITTPNSPTSAVTNLGVGLNTFRWTINNGPCGSTVFDDVVITVFSTAAAAANAGADQEFCFSGASPVNATLAGNTPTSPSSGTWTRTGGGGTITFPSNPTSTVTSLPVGTNTFQWTINNGACGNTNDQIIIRVFDPTQSPANAGADQSICSSTASVNLSANTLIAPATGTWTVVSGTGTFANANAPSTSVSGLSVGQNVFRWTIYNGPCTSPATLFDDVVITVFSNLQPNANAGADQSICSTQATVNLNGNTPIFPATGSWSLINGTGTFAISNSPVTTVSGISVGTNTYAWTINNGPCGTSTSDQVVITEFDVNAPAANAGSDQVLCLPTTSTSLAGNAATSPGSGVWSVVSGTANISTPSSPTSTVTGIGTGVNTLRWTITNGACNQTTTDDVVITLFNNAQSTPNAGPDASLCTPTSTYTMQGSAISAPATGTWTLVSGTGTIGNANSPNATISGLGIGANVFRWTLQNGNCANNNAFDEMTIFVFDQNQPAANAGNDQALCFNGTTAVSASLLGSNIVFPGTGNWTVIAGTGTFSSSTASSTTVSGLSVGTNTFRWTVNNGACANPNTFDEVTILVYPGLQAPANAGPDQQLCSTSNNTTLSANAATFPAFGQWTVVQGTATFANASSPTTTVSGLGLGTNILQWTIFNGPCLPATTSDQVSIVVFDNNQPSANAGSDISICSSNNSASLSGNAFSAPASAQWTTITGGGTVTNGTTASPTVSNMAIGTNVFRYTIFNGPCVASTSDEITVTVFDSNQVPANAGTDQSFCLPNTNVQLLGNSPTFPATGAWSLVGGTGTIVNDSSPSTTASGLTVGNNTFRWTISNGPCAPASTSDEVTFVIFDNNQPAANAGLDQSFCEPVNSASLSANAAPYPASGVWTLVTGSGTILNANSPNTQVTGLAQGENTFRWTISNGPCAPAQTTDDVSIFIFESTQASANAGPDQTLCSPTSTATLAANAAVFPATGTWTLISGTGVVADSNNPTSSVSGLSIGENIFEWTINNGPCASAITSDRISIFVFDSNAAAASAGLDQELCTPLSVATMSANAAVFPAVGTWSVVSGNASIIDVNNPSTNVSNLTVGLVTLRWTIDNGGCGTGTTSDDITVTLYNQFSPNANAGDDQNLCTPITSATMAGSNPTFPATGTWTLVSGQGTIVDPTNPNTQITNLAIGPNVFQWTVLNGPCANGTTSDQVTITLFNGGASAPFAGTDQELCSPTSNTQLAADAAVFPGVGSWTLVNGTGTFADVNDPSSSVSGLSIGINTFRWSVNYATCGTPSDEVNIIVYDSSQGAADAGIDQELCTPNTTTNLSAESVIAPGEGTWTVIAGSGAFADLHDPNTLVTNLAIGENKFVWEVYNGPCLLAPLTTDTVSVFVFDAQNPVANAGEDQEFCSTTNNTVLNGSSITFPATGVWTLVQGTGTITDPTSPNSTINGLSVGENILEWTVSNGPCANSVTTDQVSIFIFDENQENANAGPDQSICTPTDQVTLAANPVTFPASGTWTLLSGTGSFSNPNNPSATISGLTVGETIVQWTIENGPCTNASTSDVMSIFIYDENNSVASAGQDQEFCLPTNSTSLNGSLVTFPASGVWTVIQGSATITNPTDPNTIISDLAVGENILQWTVTNGACANPVTSDQVSIFIFDPNASPANAGDDQEYCSPTSTANLNAAIPNAPGTGTWTVVSAPSAVSIADINNPNSSIDGLAIGETVLQWTVYNGPCDNTNTSDLVSIFIFDENQEDANAGANQSICTPLTSSNFEANSATYPAIGTWTVVQGSGDIADIHDPISAVTNLGVGTNVFRWTIDNGPCANGITTDDVTIDVFESEQLPANAGIDQEFCLPTTNTVLFGSALIGASTGEWTLINGTGDISDANIAQPAVTGLSQGINTFVWAVDNGACGTTSDTVAVRIYNNDAPEASAGIDQSFCTPTSTFVMQGNTPEIPGVGTWAIVSGPEYTSTGTIDDIHNPSANISGLVIGENVFSWTIYNGPCELPTVDLISIFIYDENQPAADAGEDVELCLPVNQTAMSANEAIFPAGGTWQQIQGLTAEIANVSDSLTAITNLQEGTNLFVWTIENGPCLGSLSSDTIAIRVFGNEPEIPYAGPDQSWCTPTTSTTMNATVPVDPRFGTWTLIQGNATIADIHDPNTAITDLAVGENCFLWTVYNGPCGEPSVDIVCIYVYDNSQAAANAGPDQFECTPNTTVQLAANSVIFPATGTWTILYDDQFTGAGNLTDANDPEAVVSQLVPGYNALVWTINNGVCDNAITSDTVVVEIFLNELEPAAAGEDQFLCLPQNSTTVNGSLISGAATGLWTVVSGAGSIENPTASSTNINDLPVGINLLVWTVNNGPCGITSDTLAIQVNDPLAPTASAGDDAPYCTPVSTHNMTATALTYPQIGTWTRLTGSGQIQDANDPNTLIFNLTTGENIFLWCVDNGACGAVTCDVMSIFIFNENTPNAYAGEDIEICLPTNSANMGASSAEFPAVGTWQVIEEPTPGATIIADVNDPNSLMSNLSVGTTILTWTVDNGPCPNGITSDTVAIRVFDPGAPNPFAGEDIEICTPQSVVFANGSQPVDPNYGTWQLISGSGNVEDENNPNSPITDLAVGINAFTWTFYNGTCPESLPADTMLVKVFDQSQPAASAGADIELCLPENAIELTGNALIIPATGHWELVSGFGQIQDPTNPNSLVTNLAVGTNLFVWTINNGPCENAITSDTLEIRVFDPGVNNVSAGEDIAICTPLSCVSLNANALPNPQIGTWTYVSAVNGNGNIPFGGISDLNNPQAELCGLVVGVHTLRWGIYNGPCDNGNLDDVIVSVYDATAPAATAGEDIELCAPQSSALLSANAAVFPAVGTWNIVSGSGNVVEPNNPTSALTNLQVGITVLTWTIDNGPCNAPTIDTLEVRVYDPNSPNADAGPDAEYCVNFASHTMTASNPIFPAIGTWTVISGAGDIQNENASNTQVINIPLNENIFVWTIDNGACANGITSDTVSIYVNDASIAAAFAGPDQSFCGAPDTLAMQASVAVGLAEGFWTVLNGTGEFLDTTFHESFLTNISNGYNQYLWTVDNGACGISTDTLTLTIYDPTLTQADAGMGGTICEDDFTSFNLMANEVSLPASAWWSIVEGPIQISDSLNAEALVLSLSDVLPDFGSASSTIVWTINNGVCGSSSDSISYLIRDCLTIKIPDAFSPNGDGTNDFFVIPNIDSYPQNSLKVFNRWGTQIYEASPYQNRWDGKSHHPASIGDELPVSTYYYILDLGTGEEAFHGFVYLKR